MIDANMFFMLFLMVVKTWLPSAFYIIAILYLYKKLKQKD